MTVINNPSFVAIALPYLETHVIAIATGNIKK
jgi:hypothetical protein